MEPFPPELIAQIATKLYQQGPHDPSSASHLPDASEAVQSMQNSSNPGMSHADFSNPVSGRLPEIPSAFPKGHAPFGPAAVNPTPITSGQMTSSPPLPPAAMPHVGVQSVPHAAAFNPSVEAPSRMPLAFRHLQSSEHAQRVQHAPAVGSGAADDGLARFVAQVRNQSPSKRNDCLDSDSLRLRSQLSGAQLSRGAGGYGSQVKHFSAPLDVNSIRDDFPILRQRIHGHPLAWLDNAATTQKPQVVIDSISHFYETDNSNIHRAAHSLAARATDAYEAARETTARFLGARSSKDIVFARGTTEAINLVSNTYGARYLKKDDEILLSMVEHHANIVPWQMIAKRKGAVIRVIPINDRGEIIMDEYLRLLSPRTRIVSLTHASNSLGSILPVAEMTHMAKRYGARVLIDGAQSVSHIPINVQAIGCDFFVFSGHKIFGPTGVGALYVTEELHDVLPPWQGGGNMIKNVTFEKTTYSEAPAKFEAGTPNIADAVGLKAALDYVASIGLDNIAAHEHALMADATTQLSRIPGLRIIGNAKEKVSVISFVLDGHSTEEVGKALDRAGIAVRSGHHCAQPSLRRFGLESTVRPSFSIYNTHDEVNRLAAAVRSLSRS